jgi:hypothetical protein
METWLETVVRKPVWRWESSHRKSRIVRPHPKVLGALGGSKEGPKNLHFYEDPSEVDAVVQGPHAENQSQGYKFCHHLDSDPTYKLYGFGRSDFIPLCFGFLIHRIATDNKWESIMTINIQHTGCATNTLCVSSVLTREDRAAMFLPACSFPSGGM